MAAKPDAGSKPALPSLQLRDAILALLVLQTTAIVLLMRYSKTRGSSGDGPPYIASAAVFMAEVLKLPVCLFMAGRAVGGYVALKEQCDALHSH